MSNRIRIGSAALIIMVAACGSQVVQFPNGPDASVVPVVVVDAHVADSKPTDSSSPIVDATAPPVDANIKIDVLSPQVDAAKDVLSPPIDATKDVLADASHDSGQDSGKDSGLTCMTPTIGAIDLGTSGNFAILTKAGISTVPNSVITGDIGVSPIAATAITGFSLAPCTGTCESTTSTQVVGKVYAADFGAPTPSNMTTAISDMQTAFSSAAGQAPSSSANIELGAGNISGLTLAPGVYKWSTGLLLTTDVTLQGNCSDVWVFEVAQDLTVDNGVHVILSGGAVAKNVFWQVSGAANFGTTVQFQGIVLSKTAITLNTGTSITGRLLAQTAVTLNQDTVTQP